MKILFDILLYALAIYLIIFVFWFGMALSCIQYEDEHQVEPGTYCGGDDFTALIQKTHAPLIKWLFN